MTPSARPPRVGPGRSCLLTAALALVVACTPEEGEAAERQARAFAHGVKVEASERSGALVKGLRRQVRDLARAAQGELRELSRRTEQLARVGALVGASKAASGPPPPPLDESAIRCEGDLCTVDPALVEQLIRDPARLFADATLTPILAGSTIRGLTLTSIRAGGIFDRIGLVDGDTLTAVDGRPLDALIGDPAALGRLRGRHRWALTAERDGRAFTRTIARRR